MPPGSVDEGTTLRTIVDLSTNHNNNLVNWSRIVAEPLQAALCCTISCRASHGSRAVLNNRYRTTAFLSRFLSGCCTFLVDNQRGV